MAFNFTATNQENETFEFFVTESETETFNEVSDYCEQSLFAFNPEFLALHIGGSDNEDDVIEAIKATQPLCESANPLLAAAIENWQEFIEDAIWTDGAGNFLSPWDGQELEFDDLIEQLYLNKEQLKNTLSYYTSASLANLRFYQQ